MSLASYQAALPRGRCPMIGDRHEKSRCTGEKSLEKSSTDLNAPLGCVGLHPPLAACRPTTYRLLAPGPWNNVGGRRQRASATSGKTTPNRLVVPPRVSVATRWPAERAPAPHMRAAARPKESHPCPHPSSEPLVSTSLDRPPPTANAATTMGTAMARPPTA